MRTLNRPMFRYGGPIKEGVMSGIREPKKDGGMLLVGEHPKEFRDAGGREKHLAPLVVGAGMGLARLAPLAMRGARALQGLFGSRKFVKDVGTKIANTGAKGNTAPFTPVKQIFEPNKIGKYFIDSPEGRLIAGSTGLAGKVGRGVYKGGKYLASSPLTVGGGLIYAGGKFFNKDGTPASANAIAKSKASDGGPPGGGDPNMFSTPEQTIIPTKSAEELRKDRVQKYRDIMDIKGMNKDAAYNSLIAASQLINQEGDFKGSIKDGSLISKIIGATGKAFDKPSQTKDAINTLIAKAEIEKDINKEKNALENKKTNLQIKAAEKALAGDSFDEAILKSITGTSGKMPTGSKLAGILKATKGIDSVVLDGSQITPGGEVKFLQESVNEKIKEGTSVNPGAYVLNTKILIVDEQGNVSQYY